MVFLEGLLHGFAVAASIVASLRAGSRALYILDHGTIGLVDGPIIEPPPNQGSESEGSKYNPALYELSENFKHCVRLSAASSGLYRVRYQYANMARHPSSLPSTGELPGDASASSRSIKVLERFGNLLAREKRKRAFQSNQRKRKDPYGVTETYSLGYSSYTPKTFSVASADDTIREKREDPAGWDYGLATEANYFYWVEGTEPTSRRKRVAQLTAYSPNVFSDLRSSVFGIAEQDFFRSVLNGDLVSFQSNSKGAARSGGVFFFTSDGAYMIKTIPDREKETLLKILPKYHKHMQKYGRSSLLTRFCGMYGISIRQEEQEYRTSDEVGQSVLPSGAEDTIASFAPTEKEYTFVVMNAVFPAEADKFISERFDLKGSTVGREVSPEELATKKSRAVLKDLDLSRELLAEQVIEGTSLANGRLQSIAKSLLRWKNKGSKGKERPPKRNPRVGFTIGATAKAALLSQLRKDVEFLTDCQVMDYSLLVGVVLRKDSHSCNNEFEHSQEAREPQTLDRLEGPATDGSTSRSSSPSSVLQNRLNSSMVRSLTTPFRLLVSPPIYVARKSWTALRLTLDTIVTAPMPYYGSGRCGVDGGKLSILNGKRKGDRAIYYLGLIDFLQPWTTRKVLERRMKGVAGYDTDAISAVTPEEYAARFLTFLDNHIQ